MIVRVRHLAPFFALALLAGCGDKSAPSAGQAPRPSLASQVIHAGDASREQTWDGVVEAVNQVTLTAQTNARVLALPHDVNDVVPAGAVLVRFTDVEQRSSRDAALAQLASARASYGDAQASFERFSALLPKGYVSKSDMDSVRARRDAAKAALDAAQAQLAQAKQSVDYTEVRAPYAGVITRRFVHVGEAVQSGPPSPQPLIAMESLDALRVSVQVPQNSVDAIRAAKSATIIADGHRVPARDITVFPYADPATHTFTVRVEVPGQDSGLRPGTSVKVAFPVGDTKQLLVPASALVRRGELIGVYVIGDHGVSLRQLRVGDQVGDHVQVLAGLDDGETIATDPVAALNFLAQQRAKDASGHE